MKQLPMLVVLLLACIYPGTAQQLYNMNVNKFLTQKNISDKKFKEAYLDTTWRTAVITLFETDQDLPGLPTKYELRSNLLELKVNKGDIRVLYPERVKKMIISDRLLRAHTFVNGKDFLLNGAHLTTLIEVLCKGKISLYKQYTFTIIPPTENKALGIGSPEEKVSVSSNLFYSADTELLKVPGKKKFILLFGDGGPSVENYIKENDLKVSREDDLVKILNYYNDLKN